MNEINYTPTINMVEISVIDDDNIESFYQHNDYSHKAWDIFLGTGEYSANNVMLESGTPNESDVLGQKLWVSGEDVDYQFNGDVLGKHIEVIGDDHVEVEHNYNHMGNVYIRNTRVFSCGYGEVRGFIKNIGLKNTNNEYITHLKLNTPEIKETQRVVIKYTTLFRDVAFNGELTPDNVIKIGSGKWEDTGFSITTSKFTEVDKRLVFLTGGMVGSNHVLSSLENDKTTFETTTHLEGNIRESVNGRIRTCELSVTVPPISKKKMKVSRIVIPYRENSNISITFDSPIVYPTDVAVTITSEWKIVANQEIPI